MMNRVTFLADWFERNGWRPAAPRSAGGPAAQQGEGDTPACPTHKTPMKRGKRGWFCPVKLLDDDGTGRPVYCKCTA